MAFAEVHHIRVLVQQLTNKGFVDRLVEISELYSRAQDHRSTAALACTDSSIHFALPAHAKR